MKRPILVTVASILSEEVERYVLKLHERAVEKISGEIALNPWTDVLRAGENYSKNIFRIKREGPSVLLVNIATGGVEKLVAELVDSLKVPAILIANGRSNSLAASLEIKAFFKEKGLDIPVMFQNDFEMGFIESLSRTVRVEEAVRALNTLKVGFIGEPSPWLLTTHLSLDEFIKRGLKTEFIDIEEVVERFNSISGEEASKLAEEFMKKVKKAEKIEIDDVRKAYRLYLALKSLIEEKDLSCLTIKCFDLIGKLGVTACLAVSLLNSDGVIVGCEGDLGALLTMVLLRELSGKPVWMANVATLDKKWNNLLLAHCTIATDLVEGGVEVTTHYESGRPMAIRGPVAGGIVTLARIGGRRLNTVLAAVGKVTGSNFREENMCRCQVEVNLKGRVDEFINETLGNHVVMASSDLVEALKEACSRLKMKLILIE